MKMLRLLMLASVALSLAGCESRETDFPNIASAFRFVGVCSVIASVVWAYALIVSSGNRKGGG